MNKKNLQKLASVLVIAMFTLTLASCSSTSAQSPSGTQQQEATVKTTASTKTQVTVSQVSKENTFYLDVSGSVKAKDQIKVLPLTSGQISQVLVHEGDYVKEGELMFTIGGVNGKEHPLVTQSKVAETNLNQAKRLLATASAGNQTSLKASELQLSSAKHQLDGAYTDMAVMDRSKEGVQQGYSVLQDSLSRTRYKSEQDLEKVGLSINQLQDAISTLENSRYSLTRTMGTSLNNAAGTPTQETVRSQYADQLSTIDQKLNDLYSQLDSAKVGYRSAQEGVLLQDNTIIGQMIQSQTSSDVYDLNKLSMQQKMGISDNSSDTIRSAEIGLEATKIKNQSTLVQAQSSVELAKLNVDSTKNQLDYLTVKAPISGIVTDVLVSEGDLVSSSVLLTQVVNSQNYQLKVAVDATNAENVKVGSEAQVLIGGHEIPVPVSSVAPVADSSSKLVTVTLDLPKIFFRPNQVLSARIPVSRDASKQTDTVSIPLDSVIIGTEDQFVYLFKDGKAVKQSVKLGEINGSQVSIIDGVKMGDQVIVDGAKDLTDGQEVELKSSTTETKN